jgi:hypothetical protein
LSTKLYQLPGLRVPPEKHVEELRGVSEDALSIKTH